MKKPLYEDSDAKMVVGLTRSDKGVRGREITKSQRIKTPEAFRDLMLEIARVTHVPVTTGAA